MTGPERTSLSSRLKLAARAPLLCLVAAVAAMALSQQGWMQRVESALADYTAFTAKVEPRHTTTLVVVDEATVKRLGKYPYDRGRIAQALDALREAGASRIYFDASLNYAEDSLADAALEAALARLGPDRVALPVTRIASDAAGQITTRPQPRFAAHATLVATEFLFDPDRRVRNIAPLAEQGVPLTAHWIAGKAAQSAPIRINYAIDARRLKHVGLLDLLEGRVSAESLKGRPAIIGLQVASPQFTLNVPGYGALSRVDMFALAAETSLSGKEVAVLPTGRAFLLTLAIALAFAALVLRIGVIAGLIAWFALLIGWFTGIERLQLATGYILPNLAPPLAAFIVWQGLKFRDSRVARGFSRLWMRFAGVGKSALVAAADVVADPAVVFDGNGVILGANEAFRAQFLKRAARADHLGGIFAEQSAHLLSPAGDGVTRADLTVTVSQDETRHYEASVRWVETMTGRMAIASCKDVTEARERELSLARLAFRDALTGLANRVAFHARLTKLAADREPVSILMIDLDGFKKVNDTLGHHAGDLLLSGVARRIEALLRAQDFAARLGGDEFAILVMSGEETAAVLVAERLLRALREPFDIEGAEANVGASIGIALAPAHHADPHEAMKLADAAMYAAKRVKPAYAVHRPEGATPVRSIAA